MHEDLLGYLLGALEPDEMQRVSDWLKDNPEGQAQLAEIERSLQALDEGFEAVEAPSDDLIARTLDAIPSGPPPMGEDLQDFPAPKVTLTDVDLAGDARAGASRWSVMDSVGGLLSVATLLALLLPTIASGRSEARKAACQDQLRILGEAVMEYVFRDRQRRLPQVEESGPEAFAGMFAIRLSDAGLLPDASRRWCPSADVPDYCRDDGEPDLSGAQFVSMNRLPSAEALHEMSVNDLQRVQRYAGGHYAYTLGVIGEHGYSSPRFEGRTSFAVLADAPRMSTSAEGEMSVKFSHGGDGLNVLYEDGAVRFIRLEALDTLPDHPFQNHIGIREAGVNIDDASLAPSARPPFAISIQR